MSQGVLRLSNRAGVGVECRQDVLVHEVAAGVGEATSVQADMVHGEGEDTESGASRGRYQTATRQDKTDEDSTGDASVACSVVSVDVARQRVECGVGAVFGSVDVVDAPSQRAECGEGAVVGSVGSVDVVDAPSQRAECREGALVGSVGSVDVIDVPSQRADCGERALVGSVGSVSFIAIYYTDEG